MTEVTDVAAWYEVEPWKTREEFVEWLGTPDGRTMDPLLASLVAALLDQQTEQLRTSSR